MPGLRAVPGLGSWQGGLFGFRDEFLVPECGALVSVFGVLVSAGKGFGFRDLGVRVSGFWFREAPISFRDAPIARNGPGVDLRVYQFPAGFKRLV